MLEVGQRVMVRPNLIVEDLREVIPSFAPAMDKTLGKVGSIIDSRTTYASGVIYHVKFDDATLNRKDDGSPCYWYYHISWISLCDERKNEVTIMEEE